MIWLYIYIDSLFGIKSFYYENSGIPKVNTDQRWYQANRFPLWQPRQMMPNALLGNGISLCQPKHALGLCLCETSKRTSGGFEMVFQSSKSAWRNAGCKQGLSYSAKSAICIIHCIILFHTTHKTPTLQRITKKKFTTPFRPKRRVLHLKSIASRQLVKDRSWWSELLHTCEEQLEP